MRRNSRLFLLLTGTLWCLVEPASATITEYSSQASFLSAVANAGTDSFDDLAAGVELPTPLPRNAGTFSYVATAGPSSDFFTSSDGTDTWLSTNVGTDAITFSGFSAGVQAAGGFFFGTDIAGNATSTPSLTLTATDASGTVTETLVSPTTTTFFGFVSTGELISLTVAVGNQPGVWTTVNDLTLGGQSVSAVPEPSIFTLLTLGFICVLVTGHLRRAGHGPSCRR